MSTSTSVPPAPLMKALLPLMTYSLPTSSARVLSDGGVRARAGLGQAVAGELLPGGEQSPQWSRTAGGPGAQHPGGHVVDGDEGGGAGVNRRHFFKHQRGVPGGAGEAACGFRAYRPQKPSSPALAMAFGEDAFGVPLGRVRGPVRPGKVAGGLGKGALFFGVPVHGVVRSLALGEWLQGAGVWPGWCSQSGPAPLCAAREALVAVKARPWLGRFVRFADRRSRRLPQLGRSNVLHRIMVRSTP